MDIEFENCIDSPFFEAKRARGWITNFPRRQIARYLVSALLTWTPIRIGFRATDSLGRPTPVTFHCWEFYTSKWPLDDFWAMWRRLAWLGDHV